MASASTQHTALSTEPVTGYQQIASRFEDPCDCLTAHLMLECAETLAGIKPANLVSLVNRVRPCGKNLYGIWHEHQSGLTGSMKILRFRVLQTSRRALLLFCYNPQQLEKHLAHAGIRVLLGKAGYDTSLSSEELLSCLAEKIACSSTFPHEIGLFIGYPAKDVAAFMGMVKLPFTCQGPWKIFGNPEKSLCLAGSFRRTRSAMGNLLRQCASPRDCLDFVHDSRHIFFQNRIDMNFHCHDQEVRV